MTLFGRYETDEGRHPITYPRYYAAREELLQCATLLALDLGYDKARALTCDELIEMSRADDTGDLSPQALRRFHRTDLALEITDHAGEIHYAAVVIGFNAEPDAIDRALTNARLMARFTGRNAIPAIAVGRDYLDLPESALAGERPVLLDTADGEPVYLTQLLERNIEIAMAERRYERAQFG